MSFGKFGARERYVTGMTGEEAGGRPPWSESAYSIFAPTTAAICIMLMVLPAFIERRSVVLPDLLTEFVFLKISLKDLFKNNLFWGYP